jgi:hypothetical protein
LGALLALSRQKPGFPLQVLATTGVVAVGFPLQSLAHLRRAAILRSKIATSPVLMSIEMKNTLRVRFRAGDTGRLKAARSSAPLIPPPFMRMDNPTPQNRLQREFYTVTIRAGGIYLQAL